MNPQNEITTSPDSIFNVFEYIMEWARNFVRNNKKNVAKNPMEPILNEVMSVLLVE